MHVIVLNTPLDELDPYNPVIGVYATTSRCRVSILRNKKASKNKGRWVQVGRQGNPLFNEALVAVGDKDLYNRTSPRRDADLFKTYALNPQLATVLGLNATNGNDIAGNFIPDMIKRDTSTAPA